MLVTLTVFFNQLLSKSNGVLPGSLLLASVKISPGVTRNVVFRSNEWSKNAAIVHVNFGGTGMLSLKRII